MAPFLCRAHPRILLLCAAFRLIASAPASGSSSYELSPPILLPEDGGILDSGCYSGPYSVESSLTDPFFALNKSASYTLSACGDGTSCPSENNCSTVATWNDAQVELLQPSSFEADPVLYNANSGTQYLPAIATLPITQRLVIAWTAEPFDPTSATYDTVFFQVFEADGSPVTDAQPVAPGATVYQGNVSVAALASSQEGTDSFVVVWAGWNVTTSPVTNVYASRIDADGNQLADVTIATTNPMEGYAGTDTRVAAFSNGNFLVAWTARDSPESSRIAGRTYDRNGSPLSAGETNISDAGYKVSSPYIAVSTQVDEALMVFSAQEVSTRADEALVLSSASNTGDAASSSGIQAVFIDRDGEPLSGNFYIFRDSGKETYPWVSFLVPPSAPGDPEQPGSYLVSWISTSGQSDPSLRVANVSQEGDILSTSLLPDPLPQSYQPAPLIVLAESTPLLIWETGGSSGEQSILGQYLDIDGTPLDGLELNFVSVPLGYTATPVATSLGEAGLAIAWSEYNYGADNLEAQVHAQSRGGAVTLLETGLKTQQDIDLQFLWQDTVTGEQWCSPVSHYLYGEMDLSSASLSYEYTGFTNETQMSVYPVLPTDACGLAGVTLQVRSASLLSGSCENWSDWADSGVAVSTIDTEIPVELTPGACLQYRLEVAYSLGSTGWVTSDDVVEVDREDPALELEHEGEGDTLDVTLAASDAQSGLDHCVYSLNWGDYVTFDCSMESLSIPMVHGANRVEILVYDRAGNSTGRNFYHTVVLSTPTIYIQSIQEDGIYAEDVPLVYSSTGQVSSIVLYLDGELRTPIPETLINLSDGQHTVLLEGQGPDGASVTASVGFEVQHGLFTLTLLSPQTQTYEVDTLAIQYASSKALNRVWYELDGQEGGEDMTLSELPDGEHLLRLFAESTDGGSASDETLFIIERAVPELSITAPLPDQVLDDRKVDVTFESPDMVSYELGTIDSGAIESGESVDVPEDGAYTLTLTATHSSGSSIRRSVSFEVDTRMPEIELLSPRTGLYSLREIPIEYTTNLTLADVGFFLDEQPVTQLSGIEEGTHVFRLVALTRAGQAIEKIATLEVVRLEIDYPREDDVVLSYEQVPSVQMFYDASPDFANKTVQLDDAQEQLIDEAPGQAVPIQASYGDHELALKGSINEFSMTRNVRFRVGTKNITFGTNRFSYRSTNCTEALQCTVQGSIQLINSGDVDVEEPFVVRFSHLEPDGSCGSETQELEVPALSVGDSLDLAFSSFVATPEDRLVAVIDPKGLLVGEKASDNYTEVRYQAGQILEVSSILPTATTYLQDVSLIDLIDVSATGQIAEMEFSAGKTRWVDTDGSNGWGSVIDLGLLSPKNNCLSILALSDDKQVIDSRQMCFDILKLELEGFEGHSFPWSSFDSGTRIDTSAITHGELAEAEAETVARTLKEQAMAVLPSFSDDGALSYTLYARVIQSIPPQPVYQGGAPLVGGMWNVPVYGAMFVIPFTPRGGIDVSGAVLVDTTGWDQWVDDWAEEQVEALLENEALPAFEEKINDWIGDFFVGSIDLSPGDTTLLAEGFPNWHGCGFFYAVVIDLSIRSTTVEVTAIEGHEIQFQYEFKGCTLSIDPATGTVSPNIDEARVYANVKSSLVVTIGGASAQGWGLAGPTLSYIPILPFFGIVTVSADLYEQQIHVPIESAYDIKFAVNQGVPSEGAACARLEMDIHHGPTALARGGVVGYPVILAGFGFGADMKVKWELNAFGRAEAFVERVPFGTTPIPMVQHESIYSADYWIYYRLKLCFLGWCWHGGWKFADHLTDNQDYGSPYDSSDENMCRLVYL